MRFAGCAQPGAGAKNEGNWLDVAGRASALNPNRLDTTAHEEISNLRLTGASTMLWIGKSKWKGY